MSTRKMRTLGTALGVVIILALTSVCAPCGWAAVKYKTLHRFKGRTDGHQPYAGVTFDKDGNLYGTTSIGGDYNRGTVFQLTPNEDGSWAESVLHSFPNLDGKDGTE